MNDGMMEWYAWMKILHCDFCEVSFQSHGNLHNDFEYMSQRYRIDRPDHPLLEECLHTPGMREKILYEIPPATERKKKQETV